MTIDQNIDFIYGKKIKKKYDKKTKYYSGGEKRRIATYISLLKKADIILADEVSSSLDKTNALRVMEYLRSKSKNKILIVVTHDLFLIRDDDTVINMDDLSNICVCQSEDDKHFKYKKYRKYRTNLHLIHYSFLKIFNNKKQLFNFVSSFMIGLILVLLTASLKSGIVLFLEEEILNEFNYKYLLIESNNSFLYGDEDKFREYCDEAILLIDDFYFDQIKNQIYYIDVDKIVYIEISSEFGFSNNMLADNNYSYNFIINGYNKYVNNFFDSNDYIFRCPVSFFNDYYFAKGYKISDIKTNMIVLFSKDDKRFMNIYNNIVKENDNLKIRNVGIDAYLYINDLLDKLSLLLFSFSFISLFITFFLIYILIKLEIRDDEDLIKYLKINGWENKKIYTFYYLCNLIRGMLTFMVTILFYLVITQLSNIMLRKQLGISRNILKITMKSQFFIIFLISFIVTLCTILSKNQLTRIKK